MASLMMMLRLRAKGAGPAPVARELALELGDGSFAPDFVGHLPGVSNVESDLLSRRLGPAYQPWQLPVLFRNLKETHQPARPASWYYTMGLPPSAAAAEAADSGRQTGDEEDEDERAAAGRYQ